MTADALTPGVEVEVDIGPVAHGGHCVARFDGRVIFVRLALPDERAVVRITEVRVGSFCRGEVVRVLDADPRRIPAPCGHFGPGGCGGCDFQHADPGLQRELKASVIAEQLRRLAGLDLAVWVEPLPGDGFGWRTRVRWALDPQGRVGPRGVRSHRVEPISQVRPCLIATPAMNAATDTLDVPPLVRADASRRPPAGRRGRRDGRRIDQALPEVMLAQAADGHVATAWSAGAATSGEITERALGRDFAVAVDGFWQPHVAAADVLAGAVQQALQGPDLTGGTGWDLYGGVGLFAEVLAREVGAAGSVVCVESDPRAAALAARNLAAHPGASVRAGTVEQVVADLDPPVHAVVLDPPRSGAGPGVCAAIADRGPSVIVYVACDPAALARDTAALLGRGYRLAGLRAFDTFPQTHHVECVARYVPAPGRAERRPHPSDGVAAPENR